MSIEAKLHRASGALTTLSNGRHVWNADLDKVAGSHDLAPNPHDLLDSALAACTALTLELYIRRHALDVTDLRVIVDHVENKDSKGEVQYHITREISAQGALAQADLDRLLEIAEKCPIHRILRGEVAIQSNIEGSLP